MGQQIRVRAKRKRRQAYEKRLKEAAVLRKATKGRSDETKKPAAVKKAPAAKKAAAKKKAE